MCETTATPSPTTTSLVEPTSEPSGLSTVVFDSRASPTKRKPVLVLSTCPELQVCRPRRTEKQKNRFHRSRRLRSTSTLSKRVPSRENAIYLRSLLLLLVLVPPISLKNDSKRYFRPQAYYPWENPRVVSSLLPTTSFDPQRKQELLFSGHCC